MACCVVVFHHPGVVLFVPPDGVTTQLISDGVPVPAVGVFDVGDGDSPVTHSCVLSVGSVGGGVVGACSYTPVPLVDSNFHCAFWKFRAGPRLFTSTVGLFALKLACWVGVIAAYCWVGVNEAFHLTFHPVGITVPVDLFTTCHVLALYVAVPAALAAIAALQDELHFDAIF